MPTKVSGNEAALQKAPPLTALQTLSQVASFLRRQGPQRQESSGSATESSESERDTMRKVIEFPKKPQEECMAYLTGETLLIAADLQRRMIYDSDGKPVRPGELYEVTPNGVKRVA